MPVDGSKSLLWMLLMFSDILTARTPRYAAQNQSCGICCLCSRNSGSGSAQRAPGPPARLPAPSKRVGCWDFPSRSSDKETYQNALIFMKIHAFSEVFEEKFEFLEQEKNMRIFVKI